MYIPCIYLTYKQKSSLRVFAPLCLCVEFQDGIQRKDAKAQRHEEYVVVLKRRFLAIKNGAL